MERGATLPRSVCNRVMAKRSEEHTSELQSQFHLVCRLLLEKKVTPGETRSLLLVRLREPTVSCQLCCFTLLRAGETRHAFEQRQSPSKPCRSRWRLQNTTSPQHEAKTRPEFRQPKPC